MTSKVNVHLPKSYDLVVGDTFQLFYRGIIEAPNPYNYSIVATCEKGKNFPRYFEYTPLEPGKHSLNISLYNEQLELVGSSDTILNVVKPCPAKKSIKVFCLGDSLSAGGEWINEVYRRITANDGTPQGLGFSGLDFIGKIKKGSVGYEAVGGWHWKNFFNPINDSMTIHAPNNKTVEDQHSIWRDENGGLWQLESYEKEHLRFNRYLAHKHPVPEPGYLYHEKNAVNQEPIRFYKAWSPKGSPFLNEETGKIDFANYLNEINEKEIDVVYCLLGANGILRPEAVTNTREYYCKNVVLKEAKSVIDMILKECPNAKIKLLSYPLMSLRGGLGSNYGAEPPFNSHANLTNYHITLAKTYQEWAEEEEYKGKIEVINVSGQFDSEYSYPHAEKPVNTRSSTTEWIDVNGAHPLNEGYMQIADAVYRNLVKECFSEKD